MDKNNMILGACTLALLEGAVPPLSPDQHLIQAVQVVRLETEFPEPHHTDVAGESFIMRPVESAVSASAGHLDDDSAHWVTSYLLAHRIS